MDYLKLPEMDDAVSVFDIAQAHLQLECDYNVGGWLRERPSNRRRMESTGCQLFRLGYADHHRWVDIYHPTRESEEDDEVRDIYIRNVLKWGLPITEEEREVIRNRYVPEFLAQFPNMQGAE
jgi:hypothetical protein